MGSSIDWSEQGRVGRRYGCSGVGRDVGEAAVEHAQLERRDPHVEADLPPLVDEPHPERVVGIRDPPVLEGEREALGDPRLAQKTAGLRARLGDVARVAGEPLQVCGRRGQGGPHAQHARHLAQDGEPRQNRRALVTIQSEREGASHARVVERLALVIDRERIAALPRALLHGDRVAQGLHEGVTLRGREASELDHRALAADGRDLRGRVPHE
jgi:hypothetical protein